MSCTLTSSASPNPTCLGTPVILTATFPNFSGSLVSGSYTWSPSTHLNTTTGPVVIATPTSSGIYTYSITGSIASGSGSCTAYTTVSFTVNPLPTVTITPPSASIILGSSVALTASGATTYVWSPRTGLNITSGSAVIASPTSTTLYTVTGYSDGGCSDTANVLVSVFNAPTVVSSSLTSSIVVTSSFTLTTSSITSSIPIYMSGSYFAS